MEGVTMDRTSIFSWSGVAQEFEMAWWRDHPEMIRPEVTAVLSELILRRLGYAQDSFAHKEILDVGCGPTRRLQWLQGVAGIDAIEPLREFYTALTRGAALVDYREVFCEPVESLMPDLIERYQFIFAINSLDHVYDLRVALRNIRMYLVPGGRAMLSMDCDKPVTEDGTHPVCLSGAEFRAALLETGYKILREESGSCAGGFTADGWGLGRAYHFEIQKKKRG